MEGGGEEEGFCEGKSGEGVRCLLNITKYGLYPTSILAPPWGLVPFLLPFFTLILFLLIYRDFCIIIFFFFPSYFIVFSLFCKYLHLHLSSTPSCHIGYRPRSCHLIKIKICFAYHYILATGSVDFCQARLCTTYIICMPRETIVANPSRLCRLILQTAPQAEAVDLEQ